MPMSEATNAARPRFLRSFRSVSSPVSRSRSTMPTVPIVSSRWNCAASCGNTLAKSLGE
jgi:hypothetical protein